MCCLPKSNKAYSLNVYPPTKGYLEKRVNHKTYISHSISPTPQFNVGIIQILIKCLSTIFSAEFNKKKTHLSVQLKYHTFQEGLDGGGGGVGSGFH